MDDIGVVNEDILAALSARRPSRAERATDDLLREMEGILVDEYGSNDLFQLPGLLSSHVFEKEEEEDNFQTNFWKEAVDISPSEHISISRDPENYTVTPSDRHHCILEDGDGEHEMKDVSGHLKDERALFIDRTFEVVYLEANSDEIFTSASNKLAELFPFPEDSPPPSPPGSPPVTPPLPLSPPPPLLPPLPPPPPPPPSPPPPPPPSAPPPPPLPSSPPPPPLLQQYLFPPLFVGPLPQFLFHQALPLQPALMSQHIPPLSSMISSPILAAQAPALPREIVGTPTGNQSAHMVSSLLGFHTAAFHGSEVLSQQSSCFPPVGVGNAPYIVYNSSRPVEYAQGDTYINTQSSQHRQPFLPVSAPFAQRLLHPEPPPQCTPTQFSYQNASVQQHQYPSYSLSVSSDGPRRLASGEPWPVQVNEFNADCVVGGWMIAGRSCSGPTYLHEGDFGPPMEWPPINSVNFQPPAPYTATASMQISEYLSVHGVPMLPCRPDMSSINWWPSA